MAKVTAPLFSFTARGKIAKSLVYSNWKGIADVRQHVVPANPKSTAQVAQRALVTSAVAAWRNYFTNAVMRTAYNLLAQTGMTVQSGYNAFCQAAIPLLGVGVTTSMASACVAYTGQGADFTMLRLSDGATGNESGNFEMWYGATPGSLLLRSATCTIAAGHIIMTGLGTTAHTVYVKIRKGGLDRSGITKIVLIS